MSEGALDLATIDALTGGRIGRFDAPCPWCGPRCRSASNRIRRVMRIWRIEDGFATFHCARCKFDGYARDEHAPRPDPARLARARAEAEEHDRASAAERLAIARSLWQRRQPAEGSIVESYLRTRGYDRTIPKTIGFLPENGEYPPAMIAAFAPPNGDLRGIHLTKLNANGPKLGSEVDKITIGRCLGAPIVIAPPNDLLGLAITEGIEDALTVHAATGLGVWAAGAANRMPALADAIPDYIGAITVFAHDDPPVITPKGIIQAGPDNARALADALAARVLDPKDRFIGEIRIEGLP